MNKTKQVLILAIIAAAVIAVRAIPTYTPSVQANQGGGSGVQKWEYCAITGAGGAGSGFNYRGIATIRYLRADGWKEETVEFVPDFERRNDYRIHEKGALARAIAKLGDEGWEMVLKEPDIDKTTHIDIFYFKRPKQ